MKKILFTLCLSTSISAWAQQMMEIQGKVTDSKQSPLSGVVVSIPSQQRGTITTNNGTYSLQADPGTKEVVLRFTYVGFKSVDQKVDLSRGNLRDNNVVLQDDALNLNDVVITGVTNPKSKLNSSVSVSRLKSVDIQNTGANSTAEIFRSIPGIKSEASSGDGNTNITVRGIPISAGGSKYLQLQEDGLPVMQFGDIAFATADQFIRADQTISAIEAIRGGSASTLATNSPGGIINFLSKTGQTEGGSIAITTGLSYNQFRTDFNYGAPIANGLSYNVGGYYRVGEGPRTAGYSANNGGQLKANLTKQFRNGYARVYFKYLNDRTAPYFPMPVKVTGTDDKPKFESLPGFDARYGALQTPYLLHDLGTGIHGETRSQDVTEGMHAITTAVGSEVKFDLGDNWTVENRNRFAMNSGNFVGAFPAAAGTTADMLSAVASAKKWNLNGATVKDAVTGNAYTGQYAMLLHMFDVTLNNFNNFTNDFKLKKGIKQGEITLGLYKSIQNIDMSWNWNAYITEMSGNKLHPLNIFNANGAQMTTNNGQFAYGTPVWANLARRYNTQYNVTAPYIALNYNVNDKLNVDASARWDIGHATGSFVSGASAARDMNGDGIIDSVETNVEQIDYTKPRPVNYKYNYLSYSLGANYMLSESSAVFARYSTGGVTAADRILYTPSIQADGSANGVLSTISQAEVGYKTNYKKLGLFVTAFYANINEAAGFEATTQKIIENHYNSLGLEVEAAARLSKSFSVKGSATYTHARLSDGANEGNMPRRQAPFIFTASGTYTHNQFSVGMTIFGTTGSFAQDVNKLKLPGYIVFNPFINYRFAKNITASLFANNITNTLGFTESEEGSIVGNASQIIRARSIIGRTITASVSMNF